MNENLINEIYQKDTQASSANGIAFQKNKNTVTLTGTATAETNFTILNYQNAPFPFETGQYNISGGKGNDVYFRVFRISDNSNLLLDKGQGANGELKKGEKYLFWLTVNKGAVCNNLELNLQLAKGSIVKPFVENNEQNYILDIQEPMLTGDYFDLDRKKEVHNWNKITLKGTETIERIDTQASGKYRFAITVNDIQPVASDTSALAVINNLVSERLKVGSNNDTYINRKDSTMHMRINGTKQIIVYIENCSQMSVTEFKAFLQEQYNAGTPVEIWYKLATTTELDLTEAQIKALEQLNKLRFYKNVNNIMTTEDIALLQAEYSVNLKSANEKMQQQIDEIKELLSTTQTSAMLINNLQKDLVEEVK